jgi:hypothetical protein
MDQGTKTLMALVGIAVLAYVLTVLFNFLGIGFSSYGSYLAWVIALGVFYVVLPGRVGGVFKSPF